jgi:hypothetical protein
MERNSTIVGSNHAHHFTNMAKEGRRSALEYTEGMEVLSS